MGGKPYLEEHNIKEISGESCGGNFDVYLSHVFWENRFLGRISINNPK